MTFLAYLTVLLVPSLFHTILCYITILGDLYRTSAKGSAVAGRVEKKREEVTLQLSGVKEVMGSCKEDQSRPLGYTLSDPMSGPVTGRWLRHLLGRP